MSGTVLAGAKLSSALLGMPAWSAMTTGNGWVNTGGGAATAQYRIWELTNEVEVIATISNGTIANGTAACSLPAGAFPVSSQNIPVEVITTSGSALGQSPQISVTTGGLLEVYGLPTGTTVIFFHGMISLDA